MCRPTGAYLQSPNISPALPHCVTLLYPFGVAARIPLLAVASLRHFGLVDQQDGNAIANGIDAAAAGALK